MKEKILDAAEKRVRSAGFAEMSFRDIAGDVGIKSASVHYHFPTKTDLGEALVNRYAIRFGARLDRIDRSSLDTALDEFTALYAEALVLNESICLCAIMGAEAIGLPESVNQRIKVFFDTNTDWLVDLFSNHSIPNAKDSAALIVAALEGGMIVASASGDRSVFDRVTRAALHSIRGSGQPA
ncbi:MAG: TetR/AcrR family transcriptional regulator [Rhodobacteraceae bacterium]|nr:TetR/AcrR family transcriptional regulator [Paracoccaceae bacterium]